MNKTRAEAFSDGVFAVAATVLVFNIATPDIKEGPLGNALLAEWPSYAAYAISFLTIVVIWVRLSLVIYASITLFYLALPILREGLVRSSN